MNLPSIPSSPAQRPLKALLVVAAATLALGACSRQPASPPAATAAAPSAAVAAQGASIERLEPALDTIIPPGAAIEKVAGGYEFVEGPVWYDGEVRFSDLVGNKLYAVGADGQARLIMDKSGASPRPRGSYQGSAGRPSQGRLDAADPARPAPHRRVARIVSFAEAQRQGAALNS